jgi:hypothetical protein
MKKLKVGETQPQLSKEAAERKKKNYYILFLSY